MSMTKIQGCQLRLTRAKGSVEYYRYRSKHATTKKHREVCAEILPKYIKLVAELESELTYLKQGSFDKFLTN